MASFVKALTPEKLLNLLKGVDGAGSGVDADTLDGVQAQTFSDAIAAAQATADGKLGIFGTAVAATKWATSRMFNFGGAGSDVSGSASVDGSQNVSFNIQVADDSHAHSLATLPTNLLKVGELGIGGNCVDISNQNLNTATLVTGFYMGMNMNNAPDSNWWYVDAKVHNAQYLVQIAMDLTSHNLRTLKRIFVNGVWSNWVKDTRDGDYGIGTRNYGGSFLDWNQVPLESGVWNVQTGAVNRPAFVDDGYYTLFCSSYENAHYLGYCITNGELISIFRNASGVWGGGQKIYKAGNFNPSDYATVAALNSNRADLLEAIGDSEGSIYGNLVPEIDSKADENHTHNVASANLFDGSSPTVVWQFGIGSFVIKASNQNAMIPFIVHDASAQIQVVYGVTPSSDRYYLQLVGGNLEAGKLNSGNGWTAYNIEKIYRVK